MDTFKQEIKKVGNSLGIIIPANVVKFEGIIEGEKVKILIKRLVE